MGECSYNGTCVECTSIQLEYAETEANLVCCVQNTNTIEGWIKFVARTPSDCPSAENGSFYQTGLLVAVGIPLLLILTWMVFKKCKATGYNQLSPRLPARPVFQRYEEYGRTAPAPVNWEAVELDAIVASMEASTAL